MNVFLGFAVLFLSIWIFIERRANRHLKKQFKEGTYWIQYIPFHSYDIVQKLYKLNTMEKIQLETMVDEINVDLDNPKYNAVISKTGDFNFIKISVKAQDGVIEQNDIAGYNTIYTAELIAQAQSGGIKLVSVSGDV